MKNKSRKAPLLASGVLAGLLAATPARAELIAYDGFDYASGTDIRGQSGGTGWAAGSSWSGYDPRYTWPGTVTSSGLSYGSLDTQGNALTTATTPGTELSSSAIYWSGSSRNTKARNPYNYMLINYLRDFDIFFLVTTTT
jgi:hypothetical protein